MNKHWTSGQMIDHLYGVGPEGLHLETCAECRERVVAMRANRTRREQAQWIPDEFFAQQRQRIFQGTVEKRTRFWIPALATATAALALAAVLTYRPEPAADDSRLYTSIYQSIESEEPRGAAPLHALFEEATSEND